MKERPLILRHLIGHDGRRGNWSLLHSAIPKWQEVLRTDNSSEGRLCETFMDERKLLDDEGMKLNLISHLYSRELLSNSARLQPLNRTEQIMKQAL